ncbi:MAG: DnaB-like helicase C-terminal domain-containing protein [Clostridium sp.]|uniref:replicative DNA helicase n=1 Tax=Clostridium sp. TaxID=1506 RepID=UPI002A91EA62|nr:DnaB-like helicase C-terminal domain-containing protein [Clostridium sp.]MDY6228073.1 DnaB-like helicase C-terminal domain-containing protein [Clostridium sp.]
MLYESRLRADYFYNSQNKVMFEAMVSLKSLDEKINIITITKELSKNKNSKWLPSDISNLLENGMYRSAIESIEAEIISLYEKRNFRELIQKSLIKLDEEENFNSIKMDLINNIESKSIDEISVISIAECVERAIEITEEAYNSNGKITGMESGYKHLDTILNGFEKPSYIVVGARPGVGKTAFSLELARRLSEKNKILYFSLEMPFEQLGQRLLTNVTKVPLKNIKTGRITEDTFNRLLYGSSSLNKNKCGVVEKENLKIEDLVSICTSYQRKNGLDGIIIDYFTLLKSYKSFRDSRLLYNYISEELRMLSKKLKINIILLAQCNRKADDKRELQLSDLKETANLEQDANTVIFLEQKDDVRPIKEGEPREDYIRATIRKNRAGENNMQIMFRYYKGTQILDEERAGRITKAES